jgi:NitT/TauT family transport system ATP-binding protein
VTDALVHVDGLSIAFGGRQVIDGVSLEVARGELLAIVGPSGCGKSTLLNAISSLLPPEASVQGKIDLAPGARLGYVFQRDALLPWYTALRNVEIGAELRGLAAAERRAVAEELLALVHLSSAGDQYPGQLSGGMRQRVSLARALAYDPDLILLDEPFVALDAFTRMNLQDQLLDIWRKTRKTMIIVTHDPDEALALGTRLIVLDRNPGRVHDELAVDWPDDRTVETLRQSDEFLAKSKELWDVLLAVGASATTRDKVAST